MRPREARNAVAIQLSSARRGGIGLTGRRKAKTTLGLRDRALLLKRRYFISEGIRASYGSGLCGLGSISAGSLGGLPLLEGGDACLEVDRWNGGSRGSPGRTEVGAEGM